MTEATYVMVVDDDEALRESVCELLVEDGFRAVCVEDGDAALSRLRTDPDKPDVILLDLMMPVMNGWEFREEQLRDPGLARIPVVLMTARRDVDAAPGAEVLHKPIKLDKLLDAVRRQAARAKRGGEVAPPVRTHWEEAPRAARPPGLRGEAPERADGRSLFSGGGELGRRMAAMDWAKTALGPVEAWPRSLRTCVRIVLTSRQPMFVWWGEGLVNLYNDAYTSIIGGKHPEALGQPAAQVWRELWDEIGPRAERAMRASEGTYDEALLLIMERHGYPEETYYTFSYSPVPNDEGGTGGILCANTDDTQRIVGKRQLSLLRELAGRTTEDRTVADVSASSATALATNPRDLPFALVYVLADDGRTARLETAAGIDRGGRAAPEYIDVDDASSWPVGEVLQRRVTRVVTDLESRFGPLPTGAWNRPPASAALVPIAPSTETGRAGVLVVGMNPYRLFDDGYRGFLELVAAHLAASLANAQAHEEEKRRAEALAELDRAKTAFFSNVSHEFRTPLTLMLGPTRDLLAGVHGEIAPEQREQLDVLHRNGLRLQKLVNALLDFSRLEAGRVDACYEETDLAAVTREIASGFQSAFERVGLGFVIDCAPVDEPVFVDRDMWEKIVLNLLSNALKFTFDGRIELSLRDEGDRVALRVTDTGVGIDASDVPRLFVRFQRIGVARARTHEGSGIGLALVQELARLHGGAATVESILGEGTTFTVTIPKGVTHLPKDRLNTARDRASTAAGATPFVEEALRWGPAEFDDAAGRSSSSMGDARDDRRATNSLPTKRILLADDNADMRDYVRRHLERHWQVESVEDGARALAAARSHPPDLIVTDVMMPELDGFELLRELRSDDRTRGIPVIMLSARAGDEAKVEGLASGAEDYLTKPFSARELVARVRTHLELAQLRNEIHAQQHHLYLLFSEAPAPIAVLRGEQLVFEMANALYLTLCGRDDIVGKPLLQVLPELEGQGVNELLLEVMRTGEAYVGTEMLLKLDRDGDGVLHDTFWTFTYAPLRSPSGVVDRVMAFCNDVTEQALARWRVEENQERFWRIITQVRAGIAETDLTGRVTLTNARYRELVGRSEEELHQLRLLDFTHEDDLARSQAAFTKLLEDGVPFEIEKRYLKPDGSIVWVQKSASRIEDESGQPRGAAVVTIDITQRKYAERALKESEERFRNMAEHAPVMVWVTGPDGRCTYLSRSWYAFTGQAPGAGLGFGRLDVVHPEDRTQVERMLTLSKGPHESFRVEYRVRCAHGGYGWVLDSAAPTFGTNGELLGYIGSVLDVSAQKLVAREREARVAEMERAVRFSEMFIGILGHDLRNPLSAITMAANLLEGRADSDKIAKPVSRIAVSADRMERMISQLLDFTRIRLGHGLPLQRSRVDLAALCRCVIEELEPVQKREIRLEVIGDVTGEWDGDRLSQLVSNLAANACQHGTPGAEVSIRIEGFPGDGVRVEIQNRGAVPPELLQVLFEPLRHSGERPAKRLGSSGLGLGLYITQQIAVAHGGSIRVESSDGAQTRFVVELPRTAPQATTPVFDVNLTACGSPTTQNDTTESFD